MAATLTYTRALLCALLLIYSSAAEVPVPKAEAATCQATLARGGCNLSSCGRRCFRQKNGNGVCIANSKATDYSCVCTYRC